MQPGIPLSGYPQPSSHPGPIPQHINPVMRPGMMQNLQVCRTDAVTFAVCLSLSVALLKYLIHKPAVK